MYYPRELTRAPLHVEKILGIYVEVWMAEYGKMLLFCVAYFVLFDNIVSQGIS